MTDYLIINAHRQVKTYRNPTGDWLGIHYIAAFLNENGFSALAFAGYAHEVPQLLEKYADSGIYEIEDMDILKLDPFVKFGKPAKIASLFGGREGYIRAVRELEQEIYKVA